MTEKKRFRMEIIEGASLPFIVDNDSAKKQSNKIISYHTYETDKKNKCLELVELLNTLYDENEQLKQSNERFSKTVAEQIIIIKEYREENEQLKETNQELYDFRLVLNALLFNEWAETGKYEVYKSKRHHDGEPCFDGEWFIVVAILPSGQVTNHYHIKYWDYFKIPSYERVKDEFDGHTSSVVLLRYGVLLE